MAPRRPIALVLASCLLATVFAGPAAATHPPSSKVGQQWEVLAESQKAMAAGGTILIQRGNLPGGTSRFNPAPQATFRVVGKVNNATNGSWTVRLKTGTATLAEVSFSPSHSAYTVRSQTFTWPSSDTALKEIQVARSGTLPGTFDLMKASITLAQQGTIKRVQARVPIASTADVANTGFQDLLDPVYYRHVAGDFSPTPEVRLRATGRGAACVTMYVRLVDQNNSTVSGSQLNFGSSSMTSKETGALALSSGLYRVQARVETRTCTMSVQDPYVGQLFSADLVVYQTTSSSHGLTKVVGFYPSVIAPVELAQNNARLGYPVVAPDNAVELQTLTAEATVRRLTGTGQAGVALRTVAGANIATGLQTNQTAYIWVDAPSVAIPAPPATVDSYAALGTATTGRVSNSLMRAVLLLRDTITITHTPPSGPLVAGDELTIGAGVTTKCTGVHCLDLHLAVHYERADGSTATVSATGTNAGSQSFSLTVPGDDVRWSEFRYWLEATQYRCAGTSSCAEGDPGGVWLSARRPASGVTSVGVVNKLFATLQFEDGTPASDVSWYLAVEKLDGSHAEILEGEVSSGSLELVLPFTTEVEEAAQENGGHVNFSIDFLTFLDGVPMFASAAMFANFGADPAEAMIPGVSQLDVIPVTPLEPCPEVVFSGGPSTMGTCSVPISIETCPEYDYTDKSTDLVALMQIHTVYDMVVGWGQRQSANTRVMKRHYRRYQAGLVWEANGWQAVSNSEGEGDTKRLRLSPDNTFLPEGAWVAAYFEHLRRYRQKRRDRFPWDDGACIHQQWVSLGKYRGQLGLEFLESPPLGVLTRNEHANVAFEADWKRMTEDSGWERKDGKGEELASGSCWGVAVTDPLTSNIGGEWGTCSESVSGFSTSTRWLVETGLDCKQWHLYNHPSWSDYGDAYEGDYRTLPFYYADAGAMDDGTYVDPVGGKTYPEGCGPLASP